MVALDAVGVHEVGVDGVLWCGDLGEVELLAWVLDTREPPVLVV